MIKWLLKVILILACLTAFSNFVTTWINQPENSVLNPQAFAKSYGDALFSNPIFWVIISLIFVWLAFKILRKGDS